MGEANFQFFHLYLLYAILFIKRLKRNRNLFLKYTKTKKTETQKLNIFFLKKTQLRLKRLWPPERYLWGAYLYEMEESSPVHGIGQTNYETYLLFPPLFLNKTYFN